MVATVACAVKARNKEKARQCRAFLL